MVRCLIFDVGWGLWLRMLQNNGVVILRKELIIGVHQLALADCGGSLLGRHVLRPLAQIQLAKAHRNGAGGNENDLVSHVFQVA